jgi:6,7-dimethyl-8-ribityllumazine synthase
MSSFSYMENAQALDLDASQYRFGIVVTEWNNHITDVLLKGAVDTLIKYGVDESGITIERVPGSFELIYAGSQLAKRGYLDAVIVIGCVIKGDTPHFDYICQGTTQGIAHINATGDTPIIYGVLTVNNEEQALERAGGKIGNKGEEFALSAIKMADFSWKLQN